MTSPLKRGQVAEQIEEENKEIQVSARKLDHHFQTSVSERGVAKEYGDGTLYACGSQPTYVDSHYQNCKKCMPFCFVMDSWECVQKKQSHYTPPPAITFAAFLDITREMGIEPKQFLMQDQSWDVSKPVKFIKAAKTGKKKKKAETKLSFVQAWEAYDAEDKVTALRPKLPAPTGYSLGPARASTHVHQIRNHNTYTEALEYLVYNALQDGVITQDYVNLVLNNFGLMAETEDEEETQTYEKLCAASGVDVDKLYKVFQIPTADGEVDTSMFHNSPRVSAALRNRLAGNDIDDFPLTVHNKAARLAAANRTNRTNRTNRANRANRTNTTNTTNRTNRTNTNNTANTTNNTANTTNNTANTPNNTANTPNTSNTSNTSNSSNSSNNSSLDSASGSA